jgi:acyl-CoA reductase-like NAD-dependent aldehyde dehydrogenase
MRTLFLIAAAALAPPALAQSTPSGSPEAPRTPLPYDRGYDKPDPRTDAINDAARPGVQAANNAVRAATAGQPTLTVVERGAYDRDMAEYLAALREHDATAAANEALYARNQRAYADAMRAWRIQVADCNAGVRAACTAPGPRPADFW